MSPKLTILHMTHQYWLTKAFIEATKPGTEKNWTLIDESLNVAWRAQRKFEKTMEEEHDQKRVNQPNDRKNRQIPGHKALF